jgi:hypothetical protein
MEKEYLCGLYDSVENNCVLCDYNQTYMVH